MRTTLWHGISTRDFRDFYLHSTNIRQTMIVSIHFLRLGQLKLKFMSVGCLVSPRDQDNPRIVSIIRAIPVHDENINLLILQARFPRRRTIGSLLIYHEHVPGEYNSPPHTCSWSVFRSLRSIAIRFCGDERTRDRIWRVLVLFNLGICMFTKS